MLQVCHPDTEQPIHDIELDAPEDEQTQTQLNATTFPEPDWSLISFQGLLGVLQIAVTIFTRVSRIILVI